LPASLGFGGVVAVGGHFWRRHRLNLEVTRRGMKVL
jgi:hypothetical protein